MTAMINHSSKNCHKPGPAALDQMKHLLAILKFNYILRMDCVAHRNLGSSTDFAVVGAYPDGQNRDMNYGEANERPQEDRNIAGVPLPEMDPVFGATGPLVQLWHL